MVYISILVLSLSCKRVIEVEIPDRPSALVVDAQLDPDSFVSVRLSSTQKITNNNAPVTPFNSIVEIYNKDTGLLELLTDQGKGLFVSSSLKPMPGNQYLFKINADGKQHWVNETMPDTLNCLINDTSRIIFQGKQNFFQFDLKLKDRVGENYYGIRIKRFYRKYNGNDSVDTEEWVNIETIDFILTENPESKFSAKHLLFNDKYVLRPAQSLKFGVSSLFENRTEKTLRLDLYVSSYSKSAYDFYTSLNEHLFYQNDPFSQPTVVKGNVSNAFGAVVGTYTQIFRLDF